MTETTTTVDRVLYDAADGTVPEEQGFHYNALPAGDYVDATTGGVVLDTLTSGPAMAGYYAIDPLGAPLDRRGGLRLDFTLEVLRERHERSDKDGDGVGDRAGFTVTLLGSDANGVELQFWEDEVWVQDDGPAEPPDGRLFTHAEGVVLDTRRPIDYSLLIVEDRYGLLVDGACRLVGRVRDYSPWSEGVTDPTSQQSMNPYQTPDFVFLGCSTGSAAGRNRLTYVRLRAPLGADADAAGIPR